MDIKLKKIQEYHPYIIVEEPQEGDPEESDEININVARRIVAPMVTNILAIQNSERHKNRKNLYGDSKAGTIIKNSITSNNFFEFIIPDDYKSPFGTRLDICDENFRKIKQSDQPENDMFKKIVASGSYGTSFKVYLRGTDIACRIKINTDDEILKLLKSNNQLEKISGLFYSFVREIYYGIRYINPFVSIVPNFTETYGLYYCPKMMNVNKGECLKYNDYSNMADLFLVTEQVDNAVTLCFFIDDKIRPEKELVSLFYQIACALELLERFGIEHGDCHCGNILVEKTDLESYQFPERDGSYTTIKTNGYLARIIDYGLMSYDKNVFTNYYKYDNGNKKYDPDIFIFSLAERDHIKLSQEKVRDIIFSGSHISWYLMKKHIERVMKGELYKDRSDKYGMIDWVYENRRSLLNLTFLQHNPSSKVLDYIISLDGSIEKHFNLIAKTDSGDMILNNPGMERLIVPYLENILKTDNSDGVKIARLIMELSVNTNPNVYSFIPKLLDMPSVNDGDRKRVFEDISYSNPLYFDYIYNKTRYQPAIKLEHLIHNPHPIAIELLLKSIKKLGTKLRDYDKLSVLLKNSDTEIVEYLSQNPKIYGYLPEDELLKSLAANKNPTVIHYLETRQQLPDNNDFWRNISHNPSAINIILKNLDKINNSTIWSNSDREILESVWKYYKKTGKIMTENGKIYLSGNPAAINILRDNQDIIDPVSFSSNPAIFTDYKPSD